MKSLRQKFGSWIAKRFNLKNPPQWFIDYFGGGVSTSGVSVNHRGALRFTPFWASVRVISGTIGALPFKVYRRREGGGKEPQSEHRVYSLLHDAPNAYMDAVTFIETRMAHVLTYGNGYAEIQRDGAGRCCPIAHGVRSARMGRCTMRFRWMMLARGCPSPMPMCCTSKGWASTATPATTW